MSKQTERISRMEEYYDEARETLSELMTALEKYRDVEKKILRLDEYYGSVQWMQDFEAWERGKLPFDLKYGVLSEDSVYDMLTDNKEAVLDMADIVKNYLKGH